MSIVDRVGDSLVLWKSGRKDGALLNALVAVAASARKRFPEGAQSLDVPTRPMRDRESFERFFAAEFGKGPFKGVTADGRCPVNMSFRGGYEPLDHIFYKFVRCELAHEGALPGDVTFDFEAGKLAIEGDGGVVGKPLRLIGDWPPLLCSLVVIAPENAALFPLGALPEV